MAASGITQALAGKSISDKLAGAKSTLKEANDKFPSPKTTSKPSGSFASAPYKMARKATPDAPAAKSTGEDAAEGIKNNQDNVKAYTDAENK